MGKKGLRNNNGSEGEHDATPGASDVSPSEEPAGLQTVSEGRDNTNDSQDPQNWASLMKQAEEEGRMMETERLGMSNWLFSSYRRARDNLETETLSMEALESHMQRQMETASVSSSVDSAAYEHELRAPNRDTELKDPIWNDEAYSQHLQATATSLSR